MPGKYYHYPVWIRLWHFVNAICIIALILTGISMQYSSPRYPVIPFEVSVRVHNIFSIILTLSYIGFVTGNIASSNGKHYKVQVKGLGKRLKKQFNYYLTGIFRKEESPFPVNENRKFNPLQRFTYFCIMYICFPVLVLTGIALLFPEIIIDQIFGFSGLFLTAFLHTIIGFLIFLFLIVHIYFCTFGSTTFSNFKTIINGWQESH
jgi:thiosulfate reductase cytochrome b subunit